MQVFLQKSARSLTLALALAALVVLAAACTDDAERSGGPDVDLTRLVNERAATYLLEAQKVFRRGDVGTALALADSAEQHAGTASDAFLADVSFLRGRIRSELNHLDEAQRAYERVLSLVPDYRGVLMNMGNNAFRQGQFRRALDYYEREYAAYGNPQVQIYIGRAYVELGRTDSARQAFEAVIAQADTLAEAHARLAHLHDRNGDVESALPHARRALEREPENPDYHYLVGSMLLRSGRVEEAVEQLRQAVARKPDHGEAYYGLGQAMTRLERPQEARRYMAVADSLKEIDEGIRRFQTRTQLYPDDPAAWSTYGYALYQAGRDAEAMQAFQTVLHLDPRNTEVRFGVANLCLKYREIERALEHYDVILRQDETFVPAWINVGIALARIGQRDAAREAWKAALRHDPDNQLAKEYLAGIPETK